MAELILAIDQGTSGTTVLIVDSTGKVLGRAYGEIDQYFPRLGWVEHDPVEIFDGAVALARKALRTAKAKASDLCAIGLTNQRETLVVWERTSGRPLARAIVWQCRRSAELCRRLKPREPEIAARTGLVVDPYFSASKLKWLLDSTPGSRRRARRGELCFGTIESWLIFKLSRGCSHLSDLTNASRTMLLDIERLQWDDTMLELFGVPREMLPSLISSRGPLAEVAAGVLGERAVPIGAAIGDQQAALFGHGATRPGQAKATYGTGAFLLLHCGKRLVRSANRLLTTVVLGDEGEARYGLEGAVFVTGAAIQWLRDQVGLLRRAAQSEQLARASDAGDGVYLVPAFVGLGAPYWESSARGAIVGLTRNTSAGDLVRAALDSAAYQVRDVLLAMERDTKRTIDELRVDGGAAANDYLMQLQADLLDRPVRRPALVEVTAQGAAMLAGLAVGRWRSLAQAREAFAGNDKVFYPRMKRDRRERLVAGWQRAVASVLGNTLMPRSAARG